VVIVGLLGGLATIPQVDWRHSDAMTDVAGNTIMVGLVFGTLLGAPVGAVIGFLTGAILGLRSPASQSSSARSVSTGPFGKSSKPAGPFDNEFGTIRELAEKAPARTMKKWRAYWIRLGVLVLSLFIIVNFLWKYQRRYERHEIHLRLLQIASGNADVGRRALDTIRGFGPYAAPPVVEALASQDPSMRRAALLASREVLEICLGKLGEMNCITGFIPGRGSAASGFEQLATALSHSLEDEDKSLRLDAVRALSRISDDGWEGIDPPRKRIASVIKENLEKEGDPAGRRDLISLLGNLRPSLHLEGVSALVEAIGDPDEGVRQAALQTLTVSLARWGSSREKDAADKLLTVAPLILSEATKKKDVQALIALGALGEPGAVGSLVEGMHDPDQESRRNAAVALGRLGYLTFSAEVVNNDRISEELRRSIAHLIAALGDAIPDVRRHAAGALASMGAGSLQAIPALKKAAESEKDEFVRHSMIEACQSINLASEIKRSRGNAAPTKTDKVRP
jgi:HEAT repeat protein